MKTILSASVLLISSVTAFASGQSKLSSVEAEVRACYIKASTEILAIPARTVGINHATQLQAIFDLFQNEAFSYCSKEKTDFERASVAGENALVKIQCQALKASVVGLDLNQDLMTQVSVCTPY